MSEQPSGIRTSTRLEYANGFLDLGMTDEASDELEAIEGEDRLSLPVMLMRSRLYLESKHWELLEAVAKHVADHAPEEPLAWVHWAYALREVEQFEEAKRVALAGLLHHPTEAALWYNLACYYSLLGEDEKASKHLKKAMKIDASLQEEAFVDPDLAGLWDWLSGGPS